MVNARSRTQPPRKRGRPVAWPRKITCGRASVTVYRRRTPAGKVGFLVSNYSGGKRRLDSYPDEESALEAAGKLARQLSTGQVLASEMTNGEASEWAGARLALEPFKVPLLPAVQTLGECLKLVGDLPALHAAAKFYAARHKRTVAKRVADVVNELLTLKAARGASQRYLEDLRSRLGRFADAFQKDTCNVTTSEIQAWLDTQKGAAQTVSNVRRILHVFFEFAVARGYASDNPVAGTERVAVKDGEVAIYKPAELAKLLAAASADFLPCIALGAFAGLRSAEIERLEWSDVDLAGRCIVIGASRSKTASRRVVPVCDALAAWLAPYAGRRGKVWSATHGRFCAAQQETAKAAGLKWKHNALRHSYASYRFADTGDAGRVAGELGNSAAVVHKHYRELVKPADAVKWFAIRPARPAENVVALPTAANA